MSISFEKFMGGCQYRTLAASAVAELTVGSKRLQGVQTLGANAIVVLPEVHLIRTQAGGPKYIIFSPSSSTHSFVINYIHDEIETNLVTVNPGQVAWVWLADAANCHWHAQVKSLNAVRSVAHGTRGAIVNSPLPETFDPDCFDGEPCDGRTLETSGVSIPFFQNPCVALNKWKEPIRAADFHMPKYLPVIVSGSTIEDENHPFATELSDEFYNALRNGGSAHFLEYAGPASGTSRHWHHIRWSGTSGGSWRLHPSDPAVGITVTRHVWKKLIVYTVDETPYTLEVRVVTEHVMTGDQPILVETPAISQSGTTIDQFGGAGQYLEEQFGRWEVWGFKKNQVVLLSGFSGGGYNGIARITSFSADGRYMFLVGAFGATISLVNDFSSSPTVATVTSGSETSAATGAFGALINLYVFTTEVNPTFADGGTYTPVGADVPIAFTKNDPCCWGGVNHSSSFHDEKWCHPQMVLCANVATTFQAPCGSNWVPQEDADRAYCYQVPNGSPWTTSPQCCGAVAWENGRWANIVFGESGTNIDGAAACTLGGDFPTSQPLSWLTFENGAGVGRTVLKPVNPGWDEAKGELTVSSGVGISVSFCAPEQRDFDPCKGHPDQPFEGVGGTHSCFKNATTTYCCVRISESLPAYVEVNQICKRQTQVFDGACALLSDTCTVTATMTTQFQVPLYDYRYYMDANQDLREMNFKLYVQDPSEPLFHYTYSVGNIGDFIEARASTTFSAQDIELDTTSSGTGVMDKILHYDPAGSVHEDVELKATLVLDETLETSHALLVRSTINGSSQQTAYAAIFNRVTAKIEIIEITNEVASVLSTQEMGDITYVSGQARVEVTFRVDGSTLTFTFDDNDLNVGSLVANDCTITAGAVGLGTTYDASTFFEDFEVVDLTNTYEIVTANLYKTQINAAVPEILTAGYGQCDDVYNPNCGTSICGCTTYSETKTQVLNFSGTEPLVAPGTAGTGNAGLPAINPPPQCEGDPCSTGVSICDDCPPPSQVMSLKLPVGCEQASNTLLTMCRGACVWVWAQLACP